ncbi:glycosyltransferase [Herbaspirillum seropedicae]|uniref:glycosyltransferase n=1 Tax=Herbaspirillum seropedicae TaxID=964 RepID=UPI000848177D|nr:glycosyltransferase [Herbaspirillum seropedicae]AON56567.1 Glycosyltransferae [Herbaspirillum seropedicae]
MVSLNSAPLRVLHILDDFATTNTGVTSTVRQMVQWQASHCDWVGVHATGPMDLMIPEGVQLRRSDAHAWTPFWRWPATGLKGLLDFIDVNRATHLHIHEFWRAGYIAGMLASRRRNLPVILSAHGSTAPWALHGQGPLKSWKKRLYWQILGRSLLNSQVTLHAITPLEAGHMEDFFGYPAKAVIPNALNADALTGNVLAVAPSRRFVFLGRLHPVKGVDLLIEAFGKARLEDGWELVIAGPEEIPDYAAQLRAMAAASSRAAHIRFVGPVYGAEKANLLQSAWAVIVPSRTEVIGMVNLEAASLATPTVTTPNTGLDEWAQIGGILAADDAAALQAGLQACADWSLQERLRRGQESRRHVLHRYSLDTVGQQWLQLYRSTSPAR